MSRSVIVYDTGSWVDNEWTDVDPRPLTAEAKAEAFAAYQRQAEAALAAAGYGEVTWDTGRDHAPGGLGYTVDVADPEDEDDADHAQVILERVWMEGAYWPGAGE